MRPRPTATQNPVSPLQRGHRAQIGGINHVDYEAALRKRRAEHGAAQSTVEAVKYELRTYGLAAIAGPNCQRRLADLSDAQMRDVIECLDRLRPKYPAITDSLLLALAELIS
jgi:hypothetical protein